jgi:hypothetical protein
MTNTPDHEFAEATCLQCWCRTRGIGDHDIMIIASMIGVAYGAGASHERTRIGDSRAPMSIPSPELGDQALQSALLMVKSPVVSGCDG